MSKKALLQHIGVFITLGGLIAAAAFPNASILICCTCLYGGMNLFMVGTRIKHYYMLEPAVHALVMIAAFYQVYPMMMTGEILGSFLITACWFMAAIVPYWLANRFCRE
jgi:hypothetical protein